MKKSQIDYLQEITRLSLENPSAGIKFLIRNDDINDEDWFTCHEICDVELKYIWYVKESYIDDKDEYIDYLMSKDKCTEELAMKFAEMDKIKAILVKTTGNHNEITKMH